MKAIRIAVAGGSDVMKLEEVPTPTPGKGQLLVKLDAAGLNYIDTYQRSGLYPVPMPYTPGSEGAGTVVELGEGVTEFAKGDKVAWTGLLGSYAEYHAIPADRAVKVPSGMDTKLAAAIMLQGMTAHYLSHDTFPLKPGDWCLVHAGAGGVGLLLIQMAKLRGATVISTVSTEEKAKLAKEAGSDYVILYTRQDFVQESLKLAGSRKLDVVYDSVGKDTFEKGLDLLRPRGMMVLYGQSSGPVAPFNLGLLAQKGSLFITRPTLFSYIITSQELQTRATAVMNMVLSRKLKVRIGAEFPLARAKEAHDALEGRKTTGKVLLIP
jgi:NADPH2:quinone reductase